MKIFRHILSAINTPRYHSYFLIFILEPLTHTEYIAQLEYTLNLLLRLPSILLKK